MERIPVLALAALFCLSAPVASAQENPAEQSSGERWLPTLITDTPEEGFELAVTLARTGVRMTQPDVDVLRSSRPEYSHDPDSLIAASEVIAVHFQTIAAANDYWRSENQQAAD